MPLTLATTQKQFEELHVAVDRKAATVRVDAQALRNLLVDHAVLVREARARGSKVVEPVTGQRHLTSQEQRVFDKALHRSARQKQPLVR